MSVKKEILWRVAVVYIVFLLLGMLIIIGTDYLSAGIRKGQMDGQSQHFRT